MDLFTPDIATGDIRKGFGTLARPILFGKRCI